MLKDLEPYNKYYEDFNIRGQALDYYEQRLNSIHDNDANLRDMMNSMSQQ
jgi:hypothetical protein